MPRKKKVKEVKYETGGAKITEVTSNPFPPGLEPPWPSNPSRPAKFVFYCRFPAGAPIGEGRLYVETFYAPYAAKKFLEYLIGDEDPKWPNLHTFITSRNVEVRCMVPNSRLEENQIEIALNYQPTRSEKFWHLPEQTVKSIKRFLREWPDRDWPQVKEEPKRGLATRRPDGAFVSVADICEELGMKPREGRAALRKAKYEKPSWGWQFPTGSDDIKVVRKIIEGARK